MAPITTNILTEFHHFTKTEVKNTNLILIGHQETNSYHIRKIAELLNAFVHKNDLILIEYVDKGETIAQQGKFLFPPPRLIQLLHQAGFNVTQKKATIKGWDQTELGLQIGLMLTCQIKLDFNVLLGQRNSSIVKAVAEDYKKFRKIFVLAGSAHFCITPLTHSFLPASDLKQINDIQSKTLLDLKKYKPAVLSPIDTPSMTNLFGDLSFDDVSLSPQKSNRSSCILIAVALIGLSYFSSLL